MRHCKYARISTENYLAENSQHHQNSKETLKQKFSLKQLSIWRYSTSGMKSHLTKTLSRTFIVKLLSWGHWDRSNSPTTSRPWFITPVRWVRSLKANEYDFAQRPRLGTKSFAWSIPSMIMHIYFLWLVGSVAVPPMVVICLSFCPVI